MAPPTNEPYAPPSTAIDVRGHDDRQAPGKIVSWLYVASAVPEVLLGFAELLYDRHTSIGRLAFAAETVVDDLRLLLSLAWIHAAWRGIPAGFRGGISPWRSPNLEVQWTSRIRPKQSIRLAKNCSSVSWACSARSACR